MMEHYIVYKERKEYCSFPKIKYINNNNIQISFFKSPYIDHIGNKTKEIMISRNQGVSWEKWASFPDIISNHPLSQGSLRQRNDGYWFGNELLFGAISFEYTEKENIVSKKRKKLSKELSENNYIFWENKKEIITLSKKLFWRERIDGDPFIFAETNQIPGVKGFLLFPRHIRCSNSLVLLSGYSSDRKISKPFVIQLNKDDLEDYTLIDMFHGEINGSEMAIIEINEGIIYAIIRDETSPYMMESWSNDYGKTWSYPKSLIRGHPPHLLRLKDGRILCSFGYRWDHMGIRAIISKEIKRNKIIWDRNIITLRSDSGYPSEFTPHRKRKKDNGFMHVGYPVSVQLEDESILTTYYITTEDRITHIACTKWRI